MSAKTENPRFRAGRAECCWDTVPVKPRSQDWFKEYHVSCDSLQISCTQNQAPDIIL